jgi:hypothetical protein
MDAGAAGHGKEEGGDVTITDAL